MVSIRADGDTCYASHPRNTDSWSVARKYHYEGQWECNRVCCKDMSRPIWFVERSSVLMIDQLVEEFHIYWIDLVGRGDVKNVFDFERVYNEFKRSRGML